MNGIFGKYLTVLKGAASALTLGLLLGAPLGAPVLAADGAQVFTSTDAEEEGYWYSRYNLGNLAMRSGLGDVVMPDKAVMMMAIAAVDADFDAAKFKAGDFAYGDGDHVKPPMNAAPIATVYKSGDPHFITKFNPADFATQRWDPAGMDTALTGAANGYAIMKEVEWARQFHVDDHFGTPEADFGAYWRFVGMMMNMNARMQAMSFIKTSDGYDLSDGGDAVMLMALSDLQDLLGADRLANSDVPNRYHDADAAGAVAEAADTLFHRVNAGHPEGIPAQARTIKALVWYAAKTSNLDHKHKALKQIVALANSLEHSSPTNAADRAHVLAGLVEAHRTLGVDDGGIARVAAAFLDDFNADTGGFDSQTVYTIDDVGTIMGTLNALRIFETATVDADQVNEIFTSFWENAVNRSGLQMSAPPIKVAKSPFEYEGEPESFFRYGPSQPVPPMAGGEFGIAPVFATSVKLADGAWSVVDGRFDSAGAMHASNEMIWFHYDEINGFPAIDLSDVLD